MRFVQRRDSHRRMAFMAGLMASITFSGYGCGAPTDNLSTGRVSGKVTRDGQPVTGGNVMFSLIDAKGKPAAAEIGADGTYQLSTYGKGDGAIIGKHRITFSPPPGPTIDEKEHKEDSPVPPNPLAGLVPSPAEVVVKAGANTIDVELVKSK